MDERTELQTIPGTDAECFACGTDNPCGLHMTFQTDGSRLYSRVAPPEHVRGWRNLLHGGIISTILDEIMAWTAIHLLERIILTKSIRVDFLKPVTLEMHLLATGWVEEAVKDKEAKLAASLADGRGRILARGQGDFVLFHPDSRTLRRIMPDEARQELKKRFASGLSGTGEV